MRIFLPVLCYNHTCTAEFMMSLLRLVVELQQKQISCIIYPITFDSLVNRARNAAVAQFMTEEEATHMLFIDSDIEFQVDDVLRLIHANEEVVGGTYPQKWLDTERMKAVFRTEPVPPRPLDLCTHFTFSGELRLEARPNAPPRLDVEYISTGFLLIKKSAIVKMMKAYPERKYQNDIDGYQSSDPEMFFDLFSVSINPATHRFESEDYGFSRLWRETGGKLWVLPECQLVHHGWFAFGGSLARFLPPPTR